ncbi:MAG: hypothetical protein U5L06_00300 [Rhodovibrio sp.]|nr:hypothetical protein [Rhodovibrio sp.]
MTRFRRHLAALIALFGVALLPVAAAAHSAEVEGVKIGHAWAPPADGDGRPSTCRS